MKGGANPSIKKDIPNLQYGWNGFFDIGYAVVAASVNDT